MVDPELEELKREFLSEAQEKVRQMETALGGGASPEIFHRVAYIAHQLKGSGGSYGYQQISAEAAEIEHAAEGGGKDGGEAMKSRLVNHVRKLREEIEARARELPA